LKSALTNPRPTQGPMPPSSTVPDLPDSDSGAPEHRGRLRVGATLAHLTSDSSWLTLLPDAVTTGTPPRMGPHLIRELHKFILLGNYERDLIAWYRFRNSTRGVSFNSSPTHDSSHRVAWHAAIGCKWR